jgi:hypothetical protein
MILSPGTYRRGLPLAGIKGAPGRLIEIRGPEDRSAVFTAQECCNTVQLENAAHVGVRNLTLDGAGTDGPFAVASRGNCHDINLEDLTIVNFGASQSIVGISTKGPAWNWVIRGNTIVGAGTGIYLGDSDGSAPFVNGLIEYNLVIDTLGYNLQIKHQAPRPMGVGLPTGASQTVIRHNVWSKARNAAGGPNARPNVLVGHFPLTGPGANDHYDVYGNFFYENPTEALFQGEGNLVLRDNVLVNRSGSAVHIQRHNDRPRSIVVIQNTVLAAGRGISLAGADPAYEQWVVGNVVFAAQPISAPSQSDNVTGPLREAAAHLAAPDAPLGRLDLHPRPGRLLGSPLNLKPLVEWLPGRRVDFDGQPRAGAVRGAYETTGGEGAWRLALETMPGRPGD